MTQTNCHNCGAPITGPECEYCGTRFNIRVEEEPVRFGVTTAEFVNSLASLTFITANEARERMNKRIIDSL